MLKLIGVIFFFLFVTFLICGLTLALKKPEIKREEIAENNIYDRIQVRSGERKSDSRAKRLGQKDFIEEPSSDEKTDRLQDSFKTERLKNSRKEKSAAEKNAEQTDRLPGSRLTIEKPARSDIQIEKTDRLQKEEKTDRLHKEEKTDRLHKEETTDRLTKSENNEKTDRLKKKPKEEKTDRLSNYDTERTNDKASEETTRLKVSQPEETTRLKIEAPEATARLKSVHSEKTARLESDIVAFTDDIQIEDKPTEQEDYYYSDPLGFGIFNEE